MKRSELEKYLGHKITVKIIDGDVYTGILHRTGEESFIDEAELYMPKNYYFVTNEHNELDSCLFRTSHVTNLVEDKN